MIKITNGHMTLTVPKSAYRTVYMPIGFHPLKDEERVEAPADTFNTPDDKAPEKGFSDEETEDSEESDGYTEEGETEEEPIDLSEIPLSEMDYYQLCEYADQLGLDHRGIRSKKELRALIRDNT